MTIEVDSLTRLHAELETTRRRVVELEMELAACQQAGDAERARAQATQFYEHIVQTIATGIHVWRLEGAGPPPALRMVAANPISAQMTGVAPDAVVGKLMSEAFPGLMETPIPTIYARLAGSDQTVDLGEVAYGDDQVAQSIFAVKAFGLPDRMMFVSFENITERKRAEEALRQSIQQEELIRMQQTALEELSTPLIPINNEVVVMPLVGAIDSRRAQRVIETLLDGIATTRARIAILDITGVSIVDSQVANSLIRAAQAVKLLGAQVMLTGIRPEVAQTLVGLGIDLGGIISCGTLQHGIAMAMRRI